MFITARHLWKRNCAAVKKSWCVGGGNSAGQAAVFLAQTAKARAHARARERAGGEHVALSDSPHRTESGDCSQNEHRNRRHSKGTNHLEQVRWRDGQTGEIETHDIRHVFVMTGAVPATQWLVECLALDAKGFIKTGPDLSQEDLAAARWPFARPPHLLETSLPGVFAVGDVRGGNIKRVASAVGEGSIAISFVHQVLSE